MPLLTAMSIHHQTNLFIYQSFFFFASEQVFVQSPDDAEAEYSVKRVRNPPVIFVFAPRLDAVIYQVVLALHSHKDAE